MDIQLSKWGNSLAVRIPAEIARELDMGEGDTLQVQVTVDGGLSLHGKHWNRTAFAAELEKTRAALPPGTSVIEELRRDARY